MVLPEGQWDPGGELLRVGNAPCEPGCFPLGHGSVAESSASALVWPVLNVVRRWKGLYLSPVDGRVNPRMGFQAEK